MIFVANLPGLLVSHVLRKKRNEASTSLCNKCSELSVQLGNHFGFSTLAGIFKNSREIVDDVEVVKGSFIGG